VFLVISDLLAPDELGSLRATLERLPWEDGRKTAGRLGQERKRNAQLAPEHFAAGRKELLDRMMHHPEVRRCVYPARALAPVINRYAAGDGYGWHNDNPVQSGLRADISYTLFLSDPAEYEGGELVVRTPEGERVFKEQAGTAVFYPSASLHRVREVRSGVRLAAIGWVQSLVREPADRELLAAVKRCLVRLEHEPDSELFLELATVEAELARRWVEPV
jgi:PKHD-type hydroxylase